MLFSHESWKAKLTPITGQPSSSNLVTSEQP